MADDPPLTPEQIAERMAEIQERLKEFAPQVGEGQVVDFGINIARGKGPLAEAVKDLADLMRQVLRVLPADPDIPAEEREALLRALDQAKEDEGG